MSDLVAKTRVIHAGRVVAPGGKLSGLSDAERARLLRIGAAVEVAVRPPRKTRSH